MFFNKKKKRSESKENKLISAKDARAMLKEAQEIDEMTEKDVEEFNWSIEYNTRYRKTNQIILSKHRYECSLEGIIPNLEQCGYIIKSKDTSNDGRLTSLLLEF